MFSLLRKERIKTTISQSTISRTTNTKHRDFTPRARGKREGGGGGSRLLFDGKDRDVISFLRRATISWRDHCVIVWLVMEIRDSLSLSTTEVRQRLWMKTAGALKLATAASYKYP